MQQANDFHEESLALKALINDVDEAAFESVTQFKSWTINDVLRHLHFGIKRSWWPQKAKRPLALFLRASACT